MKMKKMLAAGLAAAVLLSACPQATEAATAAHQRQQQMQQQRAAQQQRAKQQAFQNQLYKAYQRGVNAYQSRNYSTAISYLSKVVQYERKAQIYEMLGDSYYQLKQPSQASKYLSLAVSAGSSSYIVLTDLGYAQMDMGNFQNAVKTLNAAANRFPQDADILWNLGNSYDKIGNRQSAAAAMKKLISVNPRYNAAPYVYLGLYLNDSDQPKNALQVFEQGVQAFPQDAELNFHVGDNLYALGDYEGCIPPLQQSLKYAPNNLDTLWTLGMAYVQLDDLDSAQEVCAKMQKIAPKDKRTIELCKVVNEKVQQKMLQQQMEQDMINQSMQDAQQAMGDDSAMAQSNDGAMQMAMGQP